MDNINNEQRKLNPISKIGNWFRNKLRRPSHSTVQQFIDKISEEKNLDSLQLGSEEQVMLSNIVNLGDVEVSDIMIPHSEIIAAPIKSSIEELTSLLIKNGHTRMPIYDGSLDTIEGVINLKDIVPFLLDRNKPFVIANVLREALIVSENMLITNLLIRMRSKRMHMAIVIDEYGGTQGLVTIEDILEEIIGEIDDEHDTVKYPDIRCVNAKTVEVAARTELKELEKFIKRDLSIENDDSEDEYDTVGGLLMMLVGHVPKSGETIQHAGLNIEVLEADPRKVKRVRITSIEGEDFDVVQTASGKSI